jgi:hypothetical protein
MTSLRLCIAGKDAVEDKQPGLNSVFLGFHMKVSSEIGLLTDFYYNSNGPLRNSTVCGVDS